MNTSTDTKVYIGAGILIAGMIAFAFWPGKPFEEKIENITRIFWHEQNHYSIYIQKAENPKIQKRHLANIKEVEIFSDVPADQKMWASGSGTINCFSGWRRGDDKKCFDYLEFHIHSEKDVDGADWNHGKSGKGATTVVQ